MGSGKETGAAETVNVGEEDVVVIWISPTTPGTVLLGMTFRGMAENMSAVNTAVEGLVADALTKAHAWDVAMAEDVKFQKLILIGLTPAVEDVDTDYAVHRTELNLEEERIDS